MTRRGPLVADAPLNHFSGILRLDPEPFKHMLEMSPGARLVACSLWRAITVFGNRGLCWSKA